MQTCRHCSTPLERKAYEMPSDLASRKFCNRSCATAHNNRLFPKKKRQAPRPKKERTPSQIGFLTKSELFARSKHYSSARNTIRAHAYKVFYQAHQNPVCAECGYARHTHVSHIRDVADFPGCATLNEINALTNLVALCPTHHWEFDHGFLPKNKFGTSGGI